MVKKMVKNITSYLSVSLRHDDVLLGLFDARREVDGLLADGDAVYGKRLHVGRLGEFVRGEV